MDADLERGARHRRGAGCAASPNCCGAIRNLLENAAAWQRRAEIAVDVTLHSGALAVLWVATTGRACRWTSAPPEPFYHRLPGASERSGSVGLRGWRWCGSSPGGTTAA